ncbi:Hypothetical Protein FCC1311_012962 [Hondaea fermentalgiana]|uniref:Calx-beta domain-containing protein n=1 Tax=Hondaea fermentalgiana TaxID=2315210 RepID=A0A2R5G443_9STRA|nr:Hypothetical Protein FCC1311_012962 [Hondaea fermentalgiana]|eukprot:GBG25079.1 Hypothetical Protein FCC1311_012962 [Hondaea fermentalgiana]
MQVSGVPCVIGVSRLEIYIQPSNGTAGEPLPVQPRVAFLDNQGRLVNTTNNPYYAGEKIFARFQVNSLPDDARYAVIEQDGREGEVPEAEIIEGWANFTGLKLDHLGEGFIINFFTESLQVDAEPFDNMLGAPYELQVVQEVGTATGGSEFLPQPIVAIVDRGGNTVDTITEGTMTVSLCLPGDGLGCSAHPGGTLTNLGISSTFEVFIVMGRAVFSGLSIDMAGTPYRLRFDSTYTGISQTVVTSQDFTVGIGRAVEVRFEQNVGNAKGGLPFGLQPIVSMRDAGGNIVVEDAVAPPFSEVEFYLSNNPTVALLSSQANNDRTLSLTGGIATALDFTIDKIGQGYQIRATANMRTATGILYTIYADSDPFDVVLGDPTALEIQRGVAGAYSGGLPFYEQPIVQLVDGGGNVFDAESSAQVTATLVESPLGFSMLGNPVATFFRGVARFRSLKIIQVGQGYKIEFTSTVDGRDLAVNHTFDVLPSCEFEMMADDAQIQDLYGHAVSLFEDTVLVGAPREDLNIREVQRVTVLTDEDAELTNQVQRVQIRGQHQTEIQVVSSCGTDASLAGYFTLTFGSRSSRPLRYDIHPSVLKSYLETDIPAMGTLTVEKIPNDACSASNSFNWTIYFSDLEGDIPELVPNYEGVSTGPSPDPTTFGYAATEFISMASASSATSVSVTVNTLSDSPYISGTFSLLVGGDGTPLGEDVVSVETSALGITSSANDVKTAVEVAVRSLTGTYYQSVYDTFNLVDVTREGPDNQGGYTWALTFPATEVGVYNWRQVQVNVSNLDGLGVNSRVTIAREGKAPLAGGFGLWFKGFGPTPQIVYDEDPASFEAKLESLPTIQDVTVARTTLSSGYVWTVTFLDTSSDTEYGFVADDPSNLPPLKADTYELRGTGARVLVEYAYAIDNMDTLKCQSVLDESSGAAYDSTLEPTNCVLEDIDQFLLPEDMPVMGKMGHETGAAYIMFRDESTLMWRQAAKLRGSDSGPYDNFGWAVSYDNSTAADGTQTGISAIGAPHAKYKGDAEVQAIECSADSGVLAFRFRSHLTDYVSYTVTAPELEAALEAASSITDVSVVYYLGTTEKINELASGSGHGLCQASSTPSASRIIALVTYIYPNNGDLPNLVPVTSDIKVDTIPILFDSSAPVGRNGHQYGAIDVSEHTKGTILAKESGDTGYSTGAAFVFTPDPGSGAESPLNDWVEEAKLMSSDGVAGDEFGFAVSVYRDTVVVGAPHHAYDASGQAKLASAGALYVFKRQEGGDWAQTQKLVVPDRASNDYLGKVVLIKGDAIVASAPGKYEKTGRVYIWKRQASTKPFVYEQAITPADSLPGDTFGSALAVDDNTLIIGAEYADGLAADVTEQVHVAGAEEAQGRTLKPGTGHNLVDSGVVYSYTRISHKNIFLLHQKLTPRTPRTKARFGHAVSLQADLLLAAEQEDYLGKLNARRYIFKIRTYIPDEVIAAAAEDEEADTPHIGNLFALTWRRQLADTSQVKEVIRTARLSADLYEGDGKQETVYTDQFEDIQTSWHSFDASAADIQTSIDRELDAGDILVTRSAADDYGGHTWLVTFLSMTTEGGTAGAQPLLGAVSRLSGGGEIEVTVSQEPLPYVHGMAHVFKREPATTGDWKQHAVLRPEVQQDGDLFGATMSMQSRYVAVGAPNRDSLDTSNTNGGAVYVFDLGFINTRFTQTEFTGSEAVGSLTVSLERCMPQCTIGRNRPPGVLALDFALEEEIVVQYLVTDGTARARADCLLDAEGTKECLWLNADDHSWDAAKRSPDVYIDLPYKDPFFVPPGRQYAVANFSMSTRYAESVIGSSQYVRYDFRAQSDYSPAGGQIVFGANVRAQSFDVTITNDEIIEQPDETVNLLLLSAGMRPVPGSDYWSVLTIQDDGDGGVGAQDTFDKLFAAEPATKARYGFAASVDGRIAVVTAPLQSSAGFVEAGAAYVYWRSDAGIWELEQQLESSNATTSGRFGLSVQTSDMDPHRIIVGAPGESPPAIYIYFRDADPSAGSDLTSLPGSWTLEAYFSLDPDIIFDPRCDPANSGTQARCNNDHNPSGHDAFFAGHNAVAINRRFAAVGAKGLEAVFMYRFRRNFEWHFFQMIKSTEYEDSMYPMGSEHRKIYVHRPLFGSSVALYDDTLLIGAPLSAAERYAEASQPTDQDVGTQCSDTGFRMGGATAPSLYAWAMNSYENAYEWSPASASVQTSYLEDVNGGLAVKSVVMCEESDAFKLTIRSNGIPDHELGLFPLTTDTMFADQEDNANKVAPQGHVVELPRFPNVTVVNPVSVLKDPKALPSGIIGLALNGVPFFNPFTTDGDDATRADSVGYSGHLVDLCNGGPVSFSSSEANMYGYRTNPVCLYDQPPEIAANVPQMTTGKYFPFEFAMNMTNPNPGQRSPKIGYALDGFPIYGPFGESGDMPTDLDDCNGRMDSVLGHYVYHITPHRAPYIIGCFRGKLSVEVPMTTNPFPEFSPGANQARDISFYARGKTFVYLLRNLADPDVDIPTSAIGLDVAPRASPFDAIGVNDVWVEQEKLTAGDAEQGDRFGSALAIDGDQVLVSAFRDSAKARSTWDFETGDLRGWTKTGTAFDTQPTFGDNSAARNIYGDWLVSNFRDYARKTYIGSSNREGTKIDIAEYIEGESRTVPYGPGSTHVDHPIPLTLPAHELREAMFGFKPSRGESVKHRGRFYIGTYEARPATFENGAFTTTYEEGRVQGDEPQGTLTSDVFQIYGTKMSFLLGGGCNPNEVYIELLVDGVPVRRETGTCREEMRRVVWDVSMYRWQSGVLRLVDASSTTWGHINFDDVRFNWHPSYESKSTTPSSDGSNRRQPAGGAMMYSGEPQAGAVYAFRRRSASRPDEPCELDCDEDGCFFLTTPKNRSSCVWEQQQKLQPSDRRPYEAFGWSVAFDDATGIAVVGAVNGRLVDALKYDDYGGRTQTGAIYVFLREPEQRSAVGTFEAKPYWLPFETIKIQYPDAAESGPDQFAYSVALSGYGAIVGAPSKPALGVMGAAYPEHNAASVRAYLQGGAMYSIDLRSVHVKFEQAEYSVLENHQTLPALQNTARIQVRRTGDLSITTHVAYTTSDITANGISEAKAAYCQSLLYTARGQEMCGDYVLTSGILTFDPDDEVVEFEVHTMNDNCNEGHSEYVLLQLSIPGGPPLLGEQYVARLRIDDDDGDEQVNRLFCPEASYRTSWYHPFYSASETPDLRGTPASRAPLPETEKVKWVLEQVK